MPMPTNTGSTNIPPTLDPYKPSVAKLMKKVQHYEGPARKILNTAEWQRMCEYKREAFQQAAGIVANTDDSSAALYDKTSLHETVRIHPDTRTTPPPTRDDTPSQDYLVSGWFDTGEKPMTRTVEQIDKELAALLNERRNLQNASLTVIDQTGYGTVLIRLVPDEDAIGIEQGDQIVVLDMEKAYLVGDAIRTAYNAAK